MDLGRLMGKARRKISLTTISVSFLFLYFLNLKFSSVFCQKWNFLPILIYSFSVYQLADVINSSCCPCRICRHYLLLFLKHCIVIIPYPLLLLLISAVWSFACSSPFISGLMLPASVGISPLYSSFHLMPTCWFSCT